MIGTRSRCILVAIVIGVTACSDSPTDVQVDDAPQFATTTGAVTYYVSPTGNDKNSGRSPTLAWATINKVNSRDLNPGDKVLFQGGATFTGSLSLTAQDAGTPANPITISTYGTGKATINATTAEAIRVYNASGYTISNLNLVGPGLGSSTKPGLNLYADLAGDVKLARFYIDNVEVSGFLRGISIGSWNNNTGYADVRVTNSIVHGNKLAGLSSYAMNPYAHQSVYVGHVRAYDNPGDATITGSPSGVGIVLGGVDGGTIERSVAYNNGYLCTSTAGPVGIWAYDSNNIVVQYNESYGNSTNGPADGGGFDLDQNTKNSTIQYNYSHDNAGPGYLLAQSLNNANHTGNVVRYNISENDARKNSNGSIVLWGKVQNAQIYNNSVFLKAPATGSPRVVYIHNSGVTTLHPSNVGIRNNIFQVTAGLRLVQAMAAALNGATNLRFENNNYFSTGTPFKISWGATTYATLSAWRTATGQEMRSGAAVGFSVKPEFSAPGAGGTIGNADALASLTAYQLMASSPMADQGLNLAQLGIVPGPMDFFGNPIMQGTQYSLGAHDR